MKIIIWLAMLALAFVPLLWSHDATQYAFCGLLTVIGSVMLLSAQHPRNPRR